MDAQLTSQQSDALFGGLCLDLGFCLGQDKIALLIKRKPRDVYSFTNAVLHSAGVHPERIGVLAWSQVRLAVATAFGE